MLELMDQEADRLLAFIRSRVSSEEDSWDIMQDVVMALWSRWNVGDIVENAVAWLFGVARNKIVDYYRRRRTRGEASLDRLLEEADGEPIFEMADLSSSGSPEREALRQELRNALLEAMRALPQEQRDVFVRTELDGQKFREIARETGVPINTLLSRKRYAVLKLRQSLSHVVR